MRFMKEAAISSSSFNTVAGYHIPVFNLKTVNLVVLQPSNPKARP